VFTISVETSFQAGHQLTLTDGTMVSLWASGQLPQTPFPRTLFSSWIVGEKGLLERPGNESFQPSQVPQRCHKPR